MRGRSASYLALALVTGVLLLALAVRQVDWPAVAEAVRHVSLGWLGLAALAGTAAQLMAAVRWRVLVNAGDEVSLADAFDFIMIGTLAGLVLPSRLGDVARAVAAGRYHSLSASRLLGTILVERLFDVIMLLAFGAALAGLMAIPPLVQGALTTLLAAAVIVAAILWMGESGPLGAIVRWFARQGGSDSRSLAIVQQFVGGISAVRTHGKVPSAFAAAALVWISSAAAARCNIAAFGLPAPWYAGAFVAVVVNLGGIVPAPPAGIGVYHYLAALAVSPWVANPSTAFAFALVTHALSIVLVLVLGSVSLARKGLSIGGLRRMAAADVVDQRMP